MDDLLQSAVVEGGGEGSALTPEDQALLLAEEAKRRAEQAAKLDAIGSVLFRLRKEAIEARAASGIEEEWQDAQDAFEGFDESTPDRGLRRNWRTKPPGQAAPNSAKQTRSTVFLNITRPYVEAAAARVSDMLFPTDDRPWGLQPTPIPELNEARKSQTPVTLPNGQPATEGDLAMAILDQAEKKAKRSEKRIEDWLVECQWHAEARKIVLDASRLGTGILKGPFPQRRRKSKVTVQNGAMTVERQSKIAPGSKRIDCWNLYPDPACGENIHNGSHVFERDDITSKRLRELKGLPGYFDEQIDEVLKQGPQTPLTEPKDYKYIDATATGHLAFDIWYFTGNLAREDLEAVGCDCGEMAEDQIPVVVTLVNDRVIKAALNPLDSGEFPYDVLTWQARDGFWAGIGVGQQISVPQRGINAATRNMMDNAGISAGPQIVTLDCIEPVDGKNEIYPRKLWRAKADADVQDVQKAFIVFNIPSMQAELLEIIQFYLRMAEDVTGLPALLQGQQGTAPETVGGMAMLQNNASAVLRRLARLFDDHITEPHIGRYYDWLLMYGEDPEEKGDFMIDARASSVLVERDIQNQALLQSFPMTQDPEFRIDKNKWAQEVLKSQKLDPKRFQYSEDDWAKIQEAMSQQPMDPRIAVAKLQTEFNERLKRLELSWQGDQNERERALKAAIAELQAEVALADQQGRSTMSVDTLRTKLADTTMKLRAQERISRDNNTVKQLTKPPTEPRGRAPRGQAYER